MVFLGGALGLLALGVWIFCIIDAITTPADQVRTLPKLAWIAIVVLLVEFGALAWLLAGRPWNARATTPRGADRPAGGFGGFGTSATSARRAPARPMSPDDDDEFLASLSRRNEERNEEQHKKDDGEDGPQPIG